MLEMSESNKHSRSECCMFWGCREHERTTVGEGDNWIGSEWCKTKRKTINRMNG